MKSKLDIRIELKENIGDHPIVELALALSEFPANFQVDRVHNFTSTRLAVEDSFAAFSHDNQFSKSYKHKISP
jgi:hypothetical protein